MKYNGLQFNAHAMGALHGVLYTNSLEAFRHWYARGVRHFEVDVNMTRDGAFVLSHDITRVSSQSKKEFLADHRVGILNGGPLLCTKGTQIDLEDCFDLMLKYSDVHIMFDFQPAWHNDESDGVRFLERFCRGFINEKIFGRSLIEVGSLEHAKIVQDSGFKNVQLWISKADALYSETGIDVLLKHEIKFVSLDCSKLTRTYVTALKDADITVYSPAWDDYDGVSAAIELGIDFATTHYPFARSGALGRLRYRFHKDIGWRLYNWRHYVGCTDLQKP